MEEVIKFLSGYDDPFNWKLLMSILHDFMKSFSFLFFSLINHKNLRPLLF